MMHTVQFSLGDSINLTWSCGHIGSIQADWLQRNQYPDFSKMATDTTPTTAVNLMYTYIILSLGLLRLSPDHE